MFDVFKLFVLLDFSNTTTPNTPVWVQVIIALIQGGINYLTLFCIFFVIGKGLNL